MWMVNGCATGQDGWTCVGSANCGSKCAALALFARSARTRMVMVSSHLVSFHRCPLFSACNNSHSSSQHPQYPPPFLDSAPANVQYPPRYFHLTFRTVPLHIMILVGHDKHDRLGLLCVYHPRCASFSLSLSLSLFVFLCSTDREHPRHILLQHPTTNFGRTSSIYIYDCTMCIIYN